MVLPDGHSKQDGPGLGPLHESARGFAGRLLSYIESHASAAPATAEIALGEVVSLADEAIRWSIETELQGRSLGATRLRLSHLQPRAEMLVRWINGVLAGKAIQDRARVWVSTLAAPLSASLPYTPVPTVGDLLVLVAATNEPASDVLSDIVREIRAFEAIRLDADGFVVA